ncbi:MAG TPA: hypothetical protein VFA68_11165 [Terriglobales bacterium]|nr:hypothetical protein [Terriglobales bacterium]
MFKALSLPLTLALSTIAFAQQNGTIPQQNPNTSSASSITLRGCINGGERFTFIESDTGSMFNIVGNTNPLAGLTGKLAEVTAREFPPDQKSAAGSFPQLEIKEARVISDVCPVKSKAPKPNAAPDTTSPTARSPQNAGPETTPYANPGAPNQTPPAVGNNPNPAGATGPPSPGTGNPPPTKPQ